MFGKDWKKVEDFIGTRTGAQIRSHAQKYFLRIEKELNGGSSEPGSNQEDDSACLDEDLSYQEQ